MSYPQKKSIEEVNAEIDELEGAIWELKHVPGSEGARQALQAELDWYHDELHQLMAAAEAENAPE